MVSHIGFYIIKQHIKDFNKDLKRFEKTAEDIPEDQVLELAGDFQVIVEMISCINKKVQDIKD